MSDNLPEEYDMLRNTLARYLEKNYDAAARRAIIASDAGWSREVWSDLAEMGVLAAAFPEDKGGIGGDPTLIGVIMAEFGKALLVEPYLPSVILCGRILAQAGEAAPEGALEGLIAGEQILALGHFEPNSRFALDHVEAQAAASGDSFVLSGAKSVVLAAPQADVLIISAREASGVSLFAVPANAPGVSIRVFQTIDGTRAGEVTLSDVSVVADARIGAPGAGVRLVADAVDFALAAMSAEAAGVCGQMCELTTEYCRTRKQFNAPIGAFQALQHKLADMLISAKEIEAVARLLASQPDTVDRPARLAAAKVQLGRSCKFVGENAIQLHGGMGMTEEMEIGQFFKRGMVLRQLFGDEDHFVGRYEALASALKFRTGPRRLECVFYKQRAADNQVNYCAEWNIPLRNGCAEASIVMRVVPQGV